MNEVYKEFIIKLLSYSPKDPLIFTGVYFWGFFAVVFGIFSIIHKRITLRNLFLFLTSIFFYYKTSGLYFTLLLLTICYDYFIGHKIYKSQNNLVRKSWLILSVTLNLLILGYFKYAYFFTDSYNDIFGTDYKVLNYFAVFKHSITGSGSIIDKIILPIGISFYTFKSISYTVDIYKQKLTPLNNILDYGFFVSFFPPLISGPIVRASEFIPQMLSKYKITGYQFGFAIFMILQGLIKKMVFGDYMSLQFIDKIYAAPETYPGFANLMAALCYSLQVYLDFSGYTDISIGVALLMGFRFKTNFNSPYKALNVAEFWRRWHIRLSTWLRDYLYIPLGGNRKGTWASHLIIAIIA
ncbi:MAG: MBOAT family protein, partial [Bacteroidetes bacterium]|nr:MBOAT family protein [Bacteroidota bacterium]